MRSYVDFLIDRLQVAKGYKAMSETIHSTLRASKALQEVDPVSFLSPKSSLSVKVGYTFTNFLRKRKLRNGLKYSSANSFSKIYSTLVTYHNGGESFIDVYFDKIFKSKFEHELRAKTRKLLMRIDDELQDILAAQKQTKDGSFDKRHKSYKKLANFDAWKDTTLKDEFDTLSIRVKNHIRLCLATGRIPLKFSMKGSTIKRRKQLGLSNPLTPFYATGQLVDNIVVSYTADWRENA
jgi:hypothetical protein